MKKGSFLINLVYQFVDCFKKKMGNTNQNIRKKDFKKLTEEIKVKEPVYMCMEPSKKKVSVKSKRKKDILKDQNKREISRLNTSENQEFYFCVESEPCMKPEIYLEEPIQNSEPEILEVNSFPFEEDLSFSTEILTDEIKEQSLVSNNSEKLEKSKKIEPKNGASHHGAQKKDEKEKKKNLNLDYVLETEDLTQVDCKMDLNLYLEKWKPMESEEKKVKFSKINCKESENEKFELSDLAEEKQKKRVRLSAREIVFENGRISKTENPQEDESLYSRFYGVDPEVVNKVALKFKSHPIHGYYYDILVKRHNEDFLGWNKLDASDNTIYSRVIRVMDDLFKSDNLDKWLAGTDRSLFCELKAIPSKKVREIYDNLEYLYPNYYSIIQLRHGESLEEWNKIPSSKNTQYGRAMDRIRDFYQAYGSSKEKIWDFLKYSYQNDEINWDLVKDKKKGMSSVEISQKYQISLEKVYQLLSKHLLFFTSEISAIIYEILSNSDYGMIYLGQSSHFRILLSCDFMLEHSIRLLPGAWFKEDLEKKKNVQKQLKKVLKSDREPNKED